MTRAAGVLVALLVATGATASAAPVPFPQVDVSRAAGTEAEVAVVVDPNDPNRLLGGSGTFERSAVRAYSSLDGGATWTSERILVPRAKPELCAAGDPAVAIDGTGAQFYAFLAVHCDDFAFEGAEELAERGERLVDIFILLASRSSAAAPWRVRLPFSHRETFTDDKEALVVDNSPASSHRGRLYLAFTRYEGILPPRILVSRSDDHGATWSRPVPVSDGRQLETFASLAVGSAGELYVAWMTVDRRVYVDRSLDGGAHFGTDVFVDRGIGYPGGFCRFPGAAVSIPAQPRRCVTMNPQVSVDVSSGPRRGTVYVTYAGAGANGIEQNVYAAAFDARLRPLRGMPAGARVQVNAPDPATYTADQFLPASAVDQANGDLWACFYDTIGDRRRIKSWFSCTVSGDGGATWAPQVRAASVSSNETVRQAREFEYGDYEGVAAAAGVAHPLWTDSRYLATSLRDEIYATSVPRESVATPAAP